jgi:hypothetical protein
VDNAVRKTYFFRHLYIKTIILPRQARDKHRKNSKKGRFSQEATAKVLHEVDDGGHMWYTNLGDMVVWLSNPE